MSTETTTEKTTETTHHPSDVDTWKKPDRNYFIFVIVSVLFGFLGMDHFYLRSFATGTQKLLFNILTLGMWYFWDLIQIVKDGDKIRKEGLNSPFDWVRGIGRGVFVPADRKETDPVYVSKKSYLVYAFLAIFLGWSGLDKFYIGEVFQGLVKLFSCFNIFIFLFGWLWVMWDSFHALFLTDSILKDGISTPMPYSILFPEASKGEMFLVTDIYDKDAAKSMGLLDWVATTFHFPSVPTFEWVRSLYRELFVPFMTPPIISALKNKGGCESPPPIVPPFSSILPTLNHIAMDSPPGMLARSVIAPETINGMSSMEQSDSAQAKGIVSPASSPLALASSIIPPIPAMPSLPSLSQAPSSMMPSTSAIPSTPSLSPAPSSILPSTSAIPSLPSLPSLPSVKPISSLPSMSSIQSAIKPQTGGGGREEVSSGPGPVIAGTLTAIVLAGGLKGLYDFISKQYG